MKMEQMALKMEEMALKMEEMAEEIRSLKEKLAAAEARADAAEARADAAEARADAAEARAEASQQACLEAAAGALRRRNKISRIAVSGEDCPICILPGKDCMLNDCGHIFHESCIVSWVSKKPLVNGCPSCRARIL